MFAGIVARPKKSATITSSAAAADDTEQSATPVVAADTTAQPRATAVTSTAAAALAIDVASGSEATAKAVMVKAIPSGLAGLADYESSSGSDSD